MPTKRRRITRQREVLSPELIDVLLTGDSDIDPFLQFDMTVKLVTELWADYGDELRREAARRGIPVPPLGTVPPGMPAGHAD